MKPIKKPIKEVEPTVVVDDSYIKKVRELLVPLKKTDPKAYQLAINKVNAFYGKELVSPESFAARRLNTQPAMSEPTVNRDELMKSVADKNKSVNPSDVKDQTIKSIWVKSLNVDKQHDDKSVAKLEIINMDGTQEDFDFSIGTTGTTGGFANADFLYKELKRNLRFSKKAKVTDADVRLSMVHVAFNDGRIKWFYGKDKAPSAEWAFAGEQQKLSAIPAAKKAREAAQKSRTAVYKNGSTTIYQMGEADIKPMHLVCDFKAKKIILATEDRAAAEKAKATNAGAQIAVVTDII